MSTIRAGSQGTGAAWRSTANGRAARSARRARAYCAGSGRRPAWVAMVSAGTVLLAAACGSPAGSAASPSRLYQQSLTYSRCMRSHGVPDFPILKQGPGGSLVHPVSPPAGMQGLKQAECMRTHGITSCPSPGTLDGGIHSPDFTAIGLDPHTLQFQAAAKACGMGPAWQVMWWWPAAAVQPGQGMQAQQSPARRAS